MKILNKKLLFLAVFFSFCINHTLADDVIIINEAQNISLDEIGILNKKDGGFGYDMWKNSDGRFVESMIKLMPAYKQDETIENLKKNMLLSVSSAPYYENTKISILNQKFKHLAIIQESASIRKMLESVPEKMIDENLYKIYFASLFLEEDYENACDHVENMLVAHNTQFWRENLIVCQAVRGFISAIDFNLSLLAEDNIKPSKELNEFLTKFRDKAQKKSASKDFWNNYLKEYVLQFENASAPPPSIMELFNSDIDEDALKKWVIENDKLSIDEKIPHIAKLYLIAENLSDKRYTEQWQRIYIYSQNNNIEIPDFVLLKLLDEASTNNRIGESVLLISHIVKDDKIIDLDFSTLNAITSALKNLSLKKPLQEISQSLLKITVKKETEPELILESPPETYLAPHPKLKPKTAQ